MTPFYYLDGPWKGNVHLGDFRPTDPLTASGEIYHKYTFAKALDDENHIYIDIASIDPNLQKLEVTEDMPFYFRVLQPITFNKVGPDGKVT